jgi:ParB/RepB/Spo0J family partition protein
MELKTIKVADAKQSATNTKGRTEGKEFDELVASIKETGVLTPVLVRAIHPAVGSMKWEVIAGNRRLAAAKSAGLKEISAQVVEMNDIEAREAQIVENLHRQDIHPIDEGELYRKLIEESKYDIANVAAKVAKSDTYVKQRLFLTNLGKQAADAYRTSKIIDGIAVLIAKLSDSDQSIALSRAVDGYNPATVKELKAWIEINIYSPLERQPWLKSAETMKAVGKCVECEPTRASLFGDVKEGACTDMKCWKRKMDAYLADRIKTEKLKAVSSEYGEGAKGTISRSEYTLVAKKGKDRCKNVIGAIIAVGSDQGQTVDICIDKKCEVHGTMKSEYGLTPGEQENRRLERKAQIKAAKKAEASRENKLAAALANVKWPMGEKQLDAALALMLEQTGANAFRTVAKRHALEVKKQKNDWGSETRDYRGAVHKMADGFGKVEKARLMFELMIDTGYGSLREAIKEL